MAGNARHAGYGRKGLYQAAAAAGPQHLAAAGAIARVSSAGLSP